MPGLFASSATYNHLIACQLSSELLSHLLVTLFYSRPLRSKHKEPQVRSPRIGVQWQMQKKARVNRFCFSFYFDFCFPSCKLKIYSTPPSQRMTKCLFYLKTAGLLSIVQLTQLRIPINTDWININKQQKQMFVVVCCNRIKQSCQIANRGNKEKICCRIYTKLYTLYTYPICIKLQSFIEKDLQLTKIFTQQIKITHIHTYAHLYMFFIESVRCKYVAKMNLQGHSSILLDILYLWVCIVLLSV